VLTTVWGISSRLVHVTVVPTGTVSVTGPKLKLSIFNFHSRHLLLRACYRTLLTCAPDSNSQHQCRLLDLQ